MFWDEQKHVFTQRQKEVHVEHLLNLQEGDSDLELVVAVSQLLFSFSLWNDS